VVLRNNVYVAPGGLHMAVRYSDGAPLIVLSDQSAVWGMRPAADVLFKSVAAAFPGASVGLVLTGMGRDGAEGLLSIRSSGGYGVVQDRSSAAVYGMPLAALNLAGADSVASLAEIPSALIRGLSALREPADVASQRTGRSTLQ
jgi:two-component system chemotaxis response regulator CheB